MLTAQTVVAVLVPPVAMVKSVVMVMELLLAVVAVAMAAVPLGKTRLQVVVVLVAQELAAVAPEVVAKAA